MIRRVVALSLVLGLASVAQGAVNVELVQSGSTVEVYLSQTEAASQWLRLVEFRFGATDPALTVSDFQWDIGAVGHYKDEGLATGPDGVAVAYAQLAETPAEQALLPATGSSLKVATFQVTCPDPGDPEYLLDVLDAGPDDLTGTVSYGFGMAAGDDIIYLNPPVDLTGGNMMFQCTSPQLFVLKWESIVTHGALGELPLEIPACPDETFSEPRNAGINLVRVTFDKPVDATGATATVVGQYGTGVDIVGIVASVANGPVNSLDITFDTGELPGSDAGDANDHAAKYAITLAGVSGWELAQETRVLNAVVGDANASRSVNNFDLAAVRARRDDGSTPGDNETATRADVNNSGGVNNFDLAAVRTPKNAVGRTNTTSGAAISCP